MSGHTSLKAFVILVWTAIFLCPPGHSSIVRSRRSVMDLATVGSIQGGLTSPNHVLDGWCANLTKHVNTTLEKFENISFNRSMASSNISSGVTLLQRLTFDLSHVKIYSLLFGQIPSHMKSQQSDLCLQDGVRQTGRLIVGMEMTERYLNGTSPSPPQPIRRSGNQTSYKDISHEMAVLKGEMRELVIMIGKSIFGSAHVFSK